MDSNYDEDLSENPFFQELKCEHNELFQRAIQEGWILCVPRCGTVQRTTLTADDIFSHVLIPSDELPETHFRTINGKEIRVVNRVVTIEENNVTSIFSTHVIFEETFYTEDYSKYKVWCLESPLERIRTPECDSCITNVSNLWDCIDLLWTESLGKNILDNIDNAIKLFLREHVSFELCSLQTQKDLIGSLYTQCLQLALSEPRLREKTHRSKHLLDNVKIAIETYMQHGIYKKLFEGISACTAYEDSNFNKIVRNLSDIQLRDLDIGPDLYDIVPHAKQSLAKINGYCTNLGKIGCLRQTIAIITKRNLKNHSCKFLSTDELLPMMVFLIIKTGVANWIAQLTCMKQFQLSLAPADEASFLITTLEAAIEHIRSGVLLGSQVPESQFGEYNQGNEVNNSDISIRSKIYDNEENTSSVSYLFEQIRLSNYDEVSNILDRDFNVNRNSVTKTETSKLCHPLCSCDKCERLLSEKLCDTIPTVQSCDDRGFTALHVACLYGRSKIVELLLRIGACVNITDYSGATPLHYAAQRGHQNALLLLLHSDANINAVDSEKNTPLHFASINGHEGCVKALLYFSEYYRAHLDVNCINNSGDTPLHHACRWGYESIVQILLEYGAKVDIENKRKLTPINSAHSLYISRLLLERKSQDNDYVFIPLLNEIKTHQVDQKFDFNDEEARSSQTISSNSLHGIRPCSMKQIKKVESLLRAIAFGDINLSCYYLGLQTPTDCKNQQTDECSATLQCHPLCTCEKCQPEGIDHYKSSQVEKDDKLDINVCNSDGYTPLHMAAMHGWSELTKLLLDNGAQPNIITKNKLLTALHLACSNRRSTIVRELAQFQGCNLNAQDINGDTALHYICNAKDVRLVEFLIENGADTTIKNNNGKTPVDIAEDNMYLNLSKILKSTKECVD